MIKHISHHDGVTMNISSGFAMLFLGLITVISMMIPRVFNSLVNESSCLWISKYSMLILFIVSAVFFFAKGILFLSGKLVPDLVADKNDRIKNSLFDSSFMLVVCIPMTATVIEFSNKMHWKIIWLVVNVMFLFWFISSLRGYKSNKHRM